MFDSVDFTRRKEKNFCIYVLDVHICLFVVQVCAKERDYNSSQPAKPCKMININFC